MRGEKLLIIHNYTNQILQLFYVASYIRSESGYPLWSTPACYCEFWGAKCLQRLPVELSCHSWPCRHSSFVLPISRYHYDLNFLRLLWWTSRGRICPLRALNFTSALQYPTQVLSIATILNITTKKLFDNPLANCFLVFRQLMWDLNDSYLSLMKSLDQILTKNLKTDAVDMFIFILNFFT